MPVAILMVIFSDLRMIPVTVALESVTCRAVYVSVEGLCHIYKRHLRFSHSESSSFYVLVYLSFLLMKHLKLITCHMNIWLVVRIAQKHFI